MIGLNIIGYGESVKYLWIRNRIMLKFTLILISNAAFFPFLLLIPHLKHYFAVYHAKLPAWTIIILNFYYLIPLASLGIWTLLFFKPKTGDNATLLGICICSQLCLFVWLAFGLYIPFVEIDGPLS